jgi:hypothetical protein
VISAPGKISKHIVEFYKNLFGSNRNQGVHLEVNFWNHDEKLDVMRTMLEADFSEKEVQLTIEGMKTESWP